MRRLLTVILSLSFFASSALTLRAQSGRNRSVPTENSNDDAKPSATNQSGVDAPDAATDARAEVVEGDVVSVNTSLVTIPVSVRDRQGRYAPDLRCEDFRVYEDGVEQRVAYFATVDQPFTVALVLRHLGLDRGSTSASRSTCTSRRPSWSR